jgi:hypothetical protein
MITQEMQAAINEMFTVMRADYAAFMPPSKGEVYTNMNEEYGNRLRIEEGSKYIKVVTGHSVHSFIVKKADAKRGWKEGDILKSASWSTPATNFVRGNVLERNFSRVSWTGAC